MSEMNLSKIRHSAAHVMAAAVQQLFPEAKFDIGPATEEGFYYDFDLPKHLVPEDLKEIEAAMIKIINKKVPFERVELTREEATQILTAKAQNFKLERLADIPEGETISFYKLGDFIDLCRGPHLEHAGQIGAVKLLSIAGSYYRGKETNPMLQRVYGTAFDTKQSMNDYFQRIEEAKKRDHRKLGKELDLFSVSEDIGPGLVLWHPKGARIRNQIESYWKDKHYANGYELVYTPHIGRSHLWETSGHIEFYREGMYPSMSMDVKDKDDHDAYYPKPMNCPFHIEIYKSNLHSYRDLPCRWAELGTVYRYEKSGVLHGLLRVRGFTQDDAHIICTPEQIEDEIARVLKFSLGIWKDFGFSDIKAYLATRPEKAVGPADRWEQALGSLQKAIDACGLTCEVDEGGGAFYGPKIDLKVRDAIGREWQTTTIQFDFNLPERFDLTYVGSDGKEHRPYMVHRALLGSIERFFGILTEHYAGAFPVWLAPEQLRLLPISDAHIAYANSMEEKFSEAGIRVSVDRQASTIGAKIKSARNQRIPYIAVIGDREVETQTFAVRNRTEGELGALSFEKIMEKIKSDLEKRV